MSPADRHDLFPGALEMMVLQTLRRGPQHGYALAQAIRDASDELVHVEEGSLNPALQRMLKAGWLAAERVAPLLAAESQRSRPSVVKGLRSVPERSVTARAAQSSLVGEPELLHCQLLTRLSERSASTQAHSIAA